jgi:hypothetical protein
MTTSAWWHASTAKDVSKLVGVAGLLPATYAVAGHCSVIELHPDLLKKMKVGFSHVVPSLNGGGLGCKTAPCAYESYEVDLVNACICVKS